MSTNDELQPSDGIKPLVIRSAFMVTIKASDVTQHVITYAESKEEAKSKVLKAWYRYEVVRVQKCHSVD